MSDDSVLFSKVFMHAVK